MAVKSEVKLLAFIGSPANSWDKAPYMSGSELDTLITAANADPNTDEIDYIVNSGGGDVSDGNKIIAALERCTKPTKAIISGYACSMGLFSCYGCDTVVATKNSIIMPHGVQSSVSGSVQDIQDHIDKMTTFNKAMATLLTARTGLTEDEVVAKFLSKDWYMTAQEALDNKLIDAIVDEEADFETIDVTASMPYGEFHASLHAKLSAGNSDSFFDKITAKVGSFFGLAPRKPIVAAVVELTDNEEFSISSMIYNLSCLNDSADYLNDNTSNPDLKTQVNAILVFTSKAIIDLTVMLYTEEAADATEAAARVKEVSSKFTAKQADKIMAGIKTDVEAQIASVTIPLKAQLADITTKYDAIKNLPGAKPSAVRSQTKVKSAEMKAIDDNPSITAEGREQMRFASFSFETAAIDND